MQLSPKVIHHLERQIVRRDPPVRRSGWRVDVIGSLRGKKAQLADSQERRQRARARLDSMFDASDVFGRQTGPLRELLLGTAQCLPSLSNQRTESFAPLGEVSRQRFPRHVGTVLRGLIPYNSLRIYDQYAVYAPFVLLAPLGREARGQRG